MDKKICNKCGRELPIEMFESEHLNGKIIIRNVCRECRAEYRKKWRKENPEKYCAQATRRQNKQTEFLNSLKKPCVICGEKEPVCIDFHHLNKEEKEFTIGKHRSRSKEWLLNEVSKCVCLCSNCHRKVHAGIINLEDYLK